MVPSPRQIFCDRKGRMIRITITPAAYAAIARRDGQFSDRPFVRRLR
jgi:hypothetical protein